MASPQPPQIIPYDQWTGNMSIYSFRPESRPVRLYNRAAEVVKSAPDEWRQNFQWIIQKTSLPAEQMGEEVWLAQAYELVALSKILTDGSSLIIFSSVEQNKWMLPIVLPPAENAAWSHWSKTRGIRLRAKLTKSTYPKNHSLWYWAAEKVLESQLGQRSCVVDPQEPNAVWDFRVGDVLRDGLAEVNGAWQPPPED